MQAGGGGGCKRTAKAEGQCQGDCTHSTEHKVPKEELSRCSCWVGSSRCSAPLLFVPIQTKVQTGEAPELGSSDRTLASNMHGSHWTATRAEYSSTNHCLLCEIPRRAPPQGSFQMIVWGGGGLYVCVSGCAYVCVCACVCLCVHGFMCVCVCACVSHVCLCV